MLLESQTHVGTGNENGEEKKEKKREDMFQFCFQYLYSGGHINPAVSVAMGALGRLPWYKVPVYVLGQLIGSFLASAMVFFIYTGIFNTFIPLFLLLNISWFFFFQP